MVKFSKIYYYNIYNDKLSFSINNNKGYLIIYLIIILNIFILCDIKLIEIKLLYLIFYNKLII